MELPCQLCDKPETELLAIGAHGSVCTACVLHLGPMIVEAPDRVLAVWPLLARDDDGSPEPRVRLPDGKSVELRERTEALKRDLSAEKRFELCSMYGDIGLFREQILEAANLLDANTPLPLVQRALDVLFAPDRASPDATERLRAHLLPC